MSNLLAGICSAIGHVQSPAAVPHSGDAENDFGELPTWNLDDLYPGIDSVQYATDMADCQKEAEEFQAKYSGKLETLLNTDPDALAQAIISYEILEEKMGRIMSYAGLTYTGNTSNPGNAKFYGGRPGKNHQCQFTSPVFDIGAQPAGRFQTGRSHDRFRETGKLPALAGRSSQGQTLPA